MCVVCVCVCVCVCVFCRYLVDIRWLKQWKKYVGYDAWDQSSFGQTSASPGPLDNSVLFRGRCAFEGLVFKGMGTCPLLMRGWGFVCIEGLGTCLL